jgi:hypothetical protein
VSCPHFLLDLLVYVIVSVREDTKLAAVLGRADGESEP